MSELATVSRIRSFHACPRQHQYRYLLRVRPRRTAAAPGFGKLVHVGLEQRDLAVQEHRDPVEVADLATSAMRAAWVHMAEERDEELDEFALLRSIAVVRGYCARWLHDDHDYEIVAVEVPFETALINPETGCASRTYRLAGRIDALWRAPDRRLWVKESKTSSEDLAPGSTYWERLRMDAQVAMYIDGAAALGLGEIAGCIYDVVLRPPLRRLLATPPENRKYTKDGALYAKQRAEDESLEAHYDRVVESIAAEPDRYYRRGEVIRLDKELDEFRWDVWNTLKNMRAAELSGRHVRNPAACFSWGRACEYWPVCTGAASIDDPALYMRYETQHPELPSPVPEGNGGQS